MVCARTKQTEQTIEIYALGIAFAHTNVPLSSERTWTLFHHPPYLSHHKTKVYQIGSTLKKSKDYIAGNGSF